MSTEDEADALAALNEANEALRRVNAQLVKRAGRQAVIRTTAWLLAAGAAVALVVTLLVFASILNRRSPVLAYDRCHDGRLDTVVLDLTVLVQDQPPATKDVDKLVADARRLYTATRPHMKGACPPLPG